MLVLIEAVILKLGSAEHLEVKDEKTLVHQKLADEVTKVIVGPNEIQM